MVSSGHWKGVTAGTGCTRRLPDAKGSPEMPHFRGNRAAPTREKHAPKEEGRRGGRGRGEVGDRGQSLVLLFWQRFVVQQR